MQWFSGRTQGSRQVGSFLWIHNVWGTSFGAKRLFLTHRRFWKTRSVGTRTYVRAPRSWDFRLTGTRELRGQDVECWDSDDTLGSVQWDIILTLRDPQDSACCIQVLVYTPGHEWSEVVLPALPFWNPCLKGHFRPSTVGSHSALPLPHLPLLRPWMTHHVEEKEYAPQCHPGPGDRTSTSLPVCVSFRLEQDH